MIRDDLIRDEGFVPHVYEDHLGFQTLGYGFMVDELRGGGIPREVADHWLDLLIAQNWDELCRDYPWLETSPQPIQRAVQNMRYQLGRRGLAGFRKMLAALQSREYENAAREALDSRWAQQTPARVRRIHALIRSAR